MRKQDEVVVDPDGVNVVTKAMLEERINKVLQSRQSHCVVVGESHAKEVHGEVNEDFAGQL